MPPLNLEKIGQYLHVPVEAHKLLALPEKTTTLNLNFHAADGSLIIGQAHVVYYNTCRGPAKGGIRFSPTVSLEETCLLAELMVWKTALTGIPFGGGKSGICLDPRQLSRQEKISALKEFVNLMHDDLHHGRYIPAPDMGTGESDMAVIFGETHISESVTGKPVHIGGLPGRREATGRGVATTMRLAAEQLLNSKPSGLSVAVQGFGNVGSWTASFAEQMGMKVAAISDITGGLYDSKGLPINDLLDWKNQGKMLKDFGGLKRISNRDLLQLDVDILVPAACEDQITADVAEDISAKLIVEAANAPTTEEADVVLQASKVSLVPDILANSGGVIASYVEWQKAKSGSLTDVRETYATIDELIIRTFQSVCRVAQQQEVSLRMASYILAVDEVVQAMRARGWI
jgi:glutamate dehydrogenase/leucine dehydrogenase